jgi:hypothetical protein
MNHVPTVFTADMVVEVRLGKKRMTRRVLGHQQPGPVRLLGVDDKHTRPKAIFAGTNTTFSMPLGKPAIGDLLYVRETHCELPDGQVIYKATDVIREDNEGNWFASTDFHRYDGIGMPVTDIASPPRPKWKSGRFMPKRFVKSWLRCTGLRVERAGDATVEDLIAEGLKTKLRGHDAEVDLREQWAALWNRLNAGWRPRSKGGEVVGYESYPLTADDRLSIAHPSSEWSRCYPNPWVKVIEFDPCEAPELGT